MWIQNFFKSLTATATRRRPTRQRPLPMRLYFEPLEERRLLAFLPAVTYTSDASPQAVVTADFNGDGRLDLAVANSGNNTVSVLRGNGDGTFQAALNSSTGSFPESVLAADLNSDGKTDLVTVGNGRLSVLLGDGNGAFQSPRSVALPAQVPPGYTGSGALGQTAASVAIGDVNADGKLDFVARGYTSYYVVSYYDPEFDYTYYDYYYDTYVNVLLGNGDATFGPGTAYHVNNPGPGLSLRDFNGDGRMDVATDWQLLLGNGDGTLQAPVQSLVETYGAGGATVVGDVNADGNLDIVKAGYLTQVKLGYGNGSFAPPINSNIGTPPDNYISSAVLGNFDGDGFPDLAVAAPDYSYYSEYDDMEYSFPGFVSVALNNGLWTLPPPPPPIIRIGDVTVTEGNTGTRAANFTVTLSRVSDQNVTVTYATANYAALAGSDYLAASGTLTILAGQTTGSITVLVKGDRLGELNEDFAVNLGSATNATIGDGEGVGTILDDEPRISINDVTVTEGNTGAVNATFTVSLSVAYDVAVTVHYQTANGSATAGSDYAAASGDVTITAGQTTKTFTVAVLGDRSAEPTENFVVNVSAATNGLIVDSQGVGAILDNEPRISISDVTKSEGKKGQTTLFTFTVTLSAAYDQPVTMAYRTVNGTATTGDGDYIAKTGTLTFAPGQTTKTITIEVKGDSKKEANETFYLDLFSYSSNSLFTKNRGLGTIFNDD